MSISKQAYVIAIAAILSGAISSALAAQNCPSPRDPRSRAKVVGGWHAKLKHWPGQAALRLHNAASNEIAYFCGGTLINERWVLTAAHCLQEDQDGTTEQYFTKSDQGSLATSMEAYPWRLDLDPTNFSGFAELQVVLGVDNLSQVEAKNIRYAKRIIVHPKYRSATQTGNDIALIELDKRWSGPLARVSAADGLDPKTPPGAITMVAGFGSQQWRAPLNVFTARQSQRVGAGSKVLREVDLPTVSPSMCRQRYNNAAVGSEQICAGHEQGRKDSCQGDSGGPLVAFDKNGCPYQVGIVSWGDGCAEAKAYGVYTRVSAYLPWIKKHVPSVATAQSDDVAVRADRGARLKQVDASLNEITKLLGGPRGNIDFRIKRRGSRDAVSADSVQLGQQFIFEVKSRITGRLVIVDINADGDITQIFPNKFVTDKEIGRIRAGQTLRIPGSAYGFDWFRASEPVGRSKLLVLIMPDSFVSQYKAVEGLWRSKGFTPERMPTSFFANLIDQIYGLIGRRRRQSDRPVESWDHAIIPYTIIR